MCVLCDGHIYRNALDYFYVYIYISLHMES